MLGTEGVAAILVRSFFPKVFFKPKNMFYGLLYAVDLLLFHL